MEKEKQCFIIMPISDHENYSEGHFLRVYEHLIFPACENAGFIPIRADDILNTNYIAIDILKKIVESEMVLCDLSSQNPNVLYELGIRQAFNKPVVFIKDKLTKRIFDIQGFRDYEYDENLRIDTVQNDISILTDIIKSTYKGTEDSVNSLISLLGISPAKIDKHTEISKDTELILNGLSTLEKRISSLESNKKVIERSTLVSTNQKFSGGGAIYPDNDRIGERYTLEELLKLKNGDLVYHTKFGLGEVESMDVSGRNKKGIIIFNGTGSKTLLLSFAPLFKVK